MITATSYATFPRCTTYGFKSRPQYRTKITEAESGRERRDRKWAEPLHWFDGTPLGNARQREMYAVLEFYHAHGGDHDAFRFRDQMDYKSGNVEDDPTTADQPFVDLGGGSYQLVKRYIATGGRTTTRTIVLPDGATLIVQNNTGVEQPSSRWTIDEDTGILTLDGSFVGTPGGWGGEFYCRCRFAAEFEPEIVNHKIVGASCTLKELRPGDA